MGPKARFRHRREGPAFHVSYRPSNVSYRPGEWQTYDIRLIARDVEGLTAIASDPNEAEPGSDGGPGRPRIGRVPQVHIDAAREGWRKNANDALTLSLMGLPL